MLKDINSDDDKDIGIIQNLYDNQYLSVHVETSETETINIKTASDKTVFPQLTSLITTVKTY